MKNVVLTESKFDRETGISTVIINTDIGTFKGIAKADEEDMKNPSSFAGCQLAEMRALKKYVKAKYSNIKRENDRLERLLNEVETYCVGSSAIFFIKKEIRRGFDEMEKWCNLNKILELQIKNFYITYEKKLKLLEEKIKKLKENKR